MMYHFQKNIRDRGLGLRTCMIRLFALEIDKKGESNILEDQNDQRFVKMAFKDGPNENRPKLAQNGNNGNNGNLTG